jgi:hypothetical protein
MKYLGSFALLMALQRRLSGTRGDRHVQAQCASAARGNLQ